MSSPISLSNFNNIDFSVILNAVMAQTSQPLTALQNQADRPGDGEQQLQPPGDQARESRDGRGRFVDIWCRHTVHLDAQRHGLDRGHVRPAAAIPGTYDVVVNHLAKAQVTASSSTAADADTTSVGSSGTLTIGGVDVTLTGSVTLTGLASQINATPNIPVTASVVQSAPGAYRLVLTSKSTGLANGFSVAGSLIGGSGTAFTDPDDPGSHGRGRHRQRSVRSRARAIR